MTSRAAVHTTVWSALSPYTAIIGNANLALLVSAVVAMGVYARQRGASRADLAEMVETSLMSAGLIILITAAGGAFRATLQAAPSGAVLQAALCGRRSGRR